MKWKELVIFSENFCSLLTGGVLHEEAVEKASRVFTDKRLKFFGRKLRDNELELVDSSFASRFITSFYRTILQCGLETGRLPESLEVGGEYLKSMMPLSETLKRCTILSITSFMVNAGVIYYFQGTIPIFLLTALLVIFILPHFVYIFRYLREGFFSNVPFMPSGMAGALGGHEYMGKLEVCFYDFSCELRKLVLAKIEVVKAITTAIVLSIGMCLPLIYVLCAIFPDMKFVIVLGLGAISGYVWFGSIQLAYSQFIKRYADIHIWWDKA